MKLLSNIIIYLVCLSAAPHGHALLEDQLYKAQLKDGQLQILTAPHDFPIVLVWSQLIPKEYFELKSGSIPKTLVKEFQNNINKSGYAEFSFDAPLSEPLERQYYYLISEHGIDSIKPRSVRVTVEYALDKTLSKVLYANYSGVLLVDAKWNDYPGYVLKSDVELKLKANELGFPLEAIGEDDPVYPKLVNHKGVKLKKGFSIGHKRKKSVFAFVSIEKPGYPNCEFIGLQIDYDQGHPMIANWNFSKCPNDP